MSQVDWWCDRACVALSLVGVAYILYFHLVS